MYTAVARSRDLLFRVPTSIGPTLHQYSVASRKIGLEGCRSSDASMILPCRVRFQLSMRLAHRFKILDGNSELR
jgi:hypothetical protein